jgi:hypothetical protein
MKVVLSFSMTNSILTLLAAAISDLLSAAGASIVIAAEQSFYLCASINYLANILRKLSSVCVLITLRNVLQFISH